MNSLSKAGLSVLALVLVSDQTALAQPETYRFDASHTDLTFQVSHLGLSDTHGRFNNFTGELMPTTRRRRTARST